MDYTYIDLFCGAGGLSLGFDEAGFENLLAVELQPAFAKTYRRNFPDHPLLVEDIREISNERLLELTAGKTVDVIVGGPPCQGFSIAGKHRTDLSGRREKSSV